MLGGISEIKADDKRMTNGAAKGGAKGVQGWPRVAQRNHSDTLTDSGAKSDQRMANGGTVWPRVGQRITNGDQDKGPADGLI